MDQLLSNLTMASLPGLHPLVVHFPIALLVTAALFDLGCLVARRQLWLDRAAAALYVLGTVAAGAAYLSGERAAAALHGLHGDAQAALADHEEAAVICALGFVAITALRLMVSWLGRRDRRINIGFFRLLALGVALAGVVLLAVTADRGGALVYRYGVAIEDAGWDNTELEP